MGELIKFPKPEGDISDTPLGRKIIEEAKPLFQGVIDLASNQTGFRTSLDTEDGDWAVVPLDNWDSGQDPDKAG